MAAAKATARPKTPKVPCKAAGECAARIERFAARKPDGRTVDVTRCQECGSRTLESA